MIGQLLHAALFTPTRRGWGLPVLCWGEPGVGKSDMIEQLGARAGLPTECLAPGERGEGAFGVVPVPAGDGDAMVLRYPAPEWTTRMQAGGLVFVDELTTAPPALQPPLLGLCLARRIGGAQLGPRVRVLAAANEVDDAAGGYDLGPALLNRFCHLAWQTPTVEQHINFMAQASTGDHAEPLDAIQEEARVLACWPAAYAQACGLEAGYLRRFPQAKNAKPKPGSTDRAWPSDRTWEMAVRAWATARVHGLDDAQRFDLVAGCIGAATAGEWSAWVRDADLPDPSDLLDHGIPFTHDPQRLDRTMAVLQGCWAACQTAEPVRGQRAGALWTLLAGLTCPLDLLVPTTSALVRARLGVTNPVARPLLARLQPLLRAADVQPGQVWQ